MNLMDHTTIATSFNSSTEYKVIEEIFNIFKGKFTVKKENNVYNVYTDEFGKFMYETLFIYNVETSIAFAI